MTDIWDEKPESKIVGFELNEYDKNGDPLCATVHHYDVLEMDAWLEKLEDTISREWQLEENKLRRILVERGRKLEAIETYCKFLKEKKNTALPVIAVTDEIMKIL